VSDPRRPLNPVLTRQVARDPGAVLAGSIYAVPEPDRLAVAEVLAAVGLWIHADVIVAGDTHRGVEIALVRRLIARGLGPVDVHLIAADISGVLDEVCGTRADRITFPFEACVGVAGVAAVAERIRSAGAAPWVAVAPDTSLAEVEPCLPAVDGALVMLIEPGSAHDADPSLEQKVAALEPLIPVGVDGGVNEANVPSFLHAGARYIVSGRALFPAGTPDDPTSTKGI
jgi:pentose-5-phosphate-3-epimerase